MTTLKEIVCSTENRPSVVRDTTQLVDDEVASKSGLSGMAIKAGYKAVKAIKPGLIPETVNDLLDRFVDSLEGLFGDWDGAGRNGSFGTYLTDRRNQTANALLKVTDNRAKVVSNKTIRKTYEKLRPQGEKNVEAAVPGLGRLLDKYVR